MNPVAAVVAAINVCVNLLHCCAAGCAGFEPIFVLCCTAMHCLLQDLGPMKQFTVFLCPFSVLCFKGVIHFCDYFLSFAGFCCSGVLLHIQLHSSEAVLGAIGDCRWRGW